MAAPPPYADPAMGMKSQAVTLSVGWGAWARDGLPLLVAF